MNLSMRNLLFFWWQFIQKAVSSEARRRFQETMPRTHCCFHSGMAFHVNPGANTWLCVAFLPRPLTRADVGLLSKWALAAETKILGLKHLPQKYMLYNNRWWNSPPPFHWRLRYRAAARAINKVVVQWLPPLGANKIKKDSWQFSVFPNM